MREVVEKFNVYTYETAPKDIQEKIREWIINNWDLYDHAMSERLNTLKEVASLLDARLDYSLSCVPARGEFIKFIPKYEELNFKPLKKVIDQEKDCPLTGWCYDHDFIDHLSKYNFEGTLETACHEFIKSIHKEYEFMCTHEYIADLCKANEYEFTQDGKIY